MMNPGDARTHAQPRRGRANRYERALRNGALVGVTFLSCLAAGCFARTTSAQTHEAEPEAAVSSRIEVARELLDRGRIATASVERRVPARVVEVPAEVQAAENDEAVVGSLVAGRVAELKVNVGDRVARGAAVIVVQAPEVARLRADARRAEARVNLATRAAVRLEALAADGAASQAAVEHAQAELTAARAEHDALCTQLEGLGLPRDAAQPVGRASHIVLRSPIDGVVAERKAVLGGSVSPDELLLRIVAPRTRVVVARVPESRASAVALGAKASVRPREAEPGSETSCDGVVERQTGVVDEDRTVRFRIRLHERCTVTSSGRTLTVALDVAEGGPREPVLLVPASALVELRGKSVVFVQDGDTSTFSWVAVRRGASFGDLVVAEDGLREGDRVVTRGTVLLKGEVIRAEPLD